MAVYGYTRVSRANRENDGESLEVQARQLQGWAMMQGHTLANIFEERSVSGSIRIKERPVGAELWAGLKAGDTLVASKLDRMFRSALDALQMVEELKRLGVSLVLLDLGAEPVTNGLSKLFLTIAAAFAEAERERVRERIVATKRDGREQGRYLGGKVPYGFRVGPDKTLIEVEEEQAVIKAAKALRAKPMPLRKIQATLEEEHGAKLSLDALSRILNVIVLTRT